jgi:hypothetical protein
MLKRAISILSLVAAVWSVIGCDSVGQTKLGGSDADVKAAFDKLPIEERAKTIMGSPASMEFKQQKIKEMYAKEGKEPPADIMSKGGGAMGQPRADAPGNAK